jgi:hypothetical protein
VRAAGAFLISLFALWFSHRGQSAQQVREKKEELRGILERLILLQEEASALSKETDEALKAASSSFINVKRTLYLEAAESIAREIPEHITAAEYHVLGTHNELDCDYIECEKFYRLAADRSSKSSPTKRSEILRSLGWVYYGTDPSLKNNEKGREAYKKSVTVLDGRTDVYSAYLRMLGYRNWANAEIYVGDRRKALDLLKLAHNEWVKIPPANGVAWLADLRLLVYSWGHLAASFFAGRGESPENIEHGRETFRQARRILETFSETYGVSPDISPR